MLTHCKLVLWLGLYVQLSADIQEYLVYFGHIESLKPFLQRRGLIALAAQREDRLLTLAVSANSHILLEMEPVFPAKPLLLSTPMPNHYFATYLVQLTPIPPS